MADSGEGREGATVVPIAGHFDLGAANRLLSEVFAPWVQDLSLSVDRIDRTEL